MTTTERVTSTAKWAGAAVGIAVVSYAATVATTWVRYGRAAAPAAGGRDALLDRFMPTYEVIVSHQVHVAAPPDITLGAAKDHDLFGSVVTRGVVRTRELVMRVRPDDRVRPRTLLALMKSLGWGVLADVPGREVVFGAITQPWKGDVTFDAVPPADFAAFAKPGYVKIVWNLRVEPTAGGSILGLETRVATTDPISREKFRRYWAFVAPGSVLIRLVSFGPMKREAERRARLVAR
jgi:hypothetical protein